MRTPLYDSDESGSELSGSWLDISKDEELEDDDHLSSTASAVGSSTISNISPSEVSSDTEGFSLSSDESQPDLDADNDVDVDVESDTDEDKTPAASFDKFTSGFIFPDPTSSFSTIDETPVPSIYNVPSEPLWQGVNDRLPPDTASDSSPTKSTSTAEATDKKQAATDHPFQARSPATAPSRRRFLTAIASAVALSLLVKIGPMILQHNIGALVANTFSAPGPLDAVPTYTPPAAAKTSQRASDESVFARALAALSEQPTEPSQPKAQSKTAPQSKTDPRTVVTPAQDTSLSVAVKSELSVVPTSGSASIKEVIEEHFTDPMTILTKNTMYQLSNLSVWSYELLVVLSRVTVDFLAREINLAHTEIIHELSRIRAAAEMLYSRGGELADQVSLVALQSAQQVREAASVSAKQALQQANSAAAYSTRKAREAYSYLFHVATQSNRRAARGARRVMREVRKSSVRKSGAKGAQRAKSQLSSSLAAGAQLASKVGKQAVRGAFSVKNKNECKGKRCGSKSSKSKSKCKAKTAKGAGSKKSKKSRWGRKATPNPPARECEQRGFWERIAR